MKVTIIKDDGVVGVDGKFKKVDLTDLAAGIRVIQWDGVKGHIEYYDDATPNSNISTFSAFQWCVDVYNIPAQIPIVPKPPVTSITIRQAKLALLQTGRLAQVDALIAGLPGVQGDASRIEWEFASDVLKTHPLVVAMAQAIPLTAQQLTDLFELGATL